MIYGKIKIGTVLPQKGRLVFKTNLSSKEVHKLLDKPKILSICSSVKEL